MSYKGEWRVDLPHGQGEGVYPNQSRYKGTWEYGVKTGLGTFVESQGRKRIVDGQFQDGKIEGYASIRYQNGDRY